MFYDEKSKKLPDEVLEKVEQGMKTYDVYEESLVHFRIDATSPKHALEIYWGEEQPIGSFYKVSALDIGESDVWVADE